MPTQPYRMVMRLVVLGDHNVGKTSLLQAFRRRNLGNFRGRRHSYPLRPFITMDIELGRNGELLLIKAVDTGGQEKFRSLTASYYRGAHGCLVLYDVTKENTFNNLQYWLHDLSEYSSNPDICTILVGTKCHIAAEDRAVSYERAQKYAESVGLKYVEVSAEEGINVTEVFETLADMIIDKLTVDESATLQQPNKVILQRDAAKTKKEWCSC